MNVFKVNLGGIMPMYVAQLNGMFGYGKTHYEAMNQVLGRIYYA
jgi:hypothetical protein